MIDLIRADVLKLARRRGVMIAVACIVVGIPLVVLGVMVIGRAVAPDTFDRYGGADGYEALIGTLQFGMFVASIMVGAIAGTQDESRGVFRDLVATGVSRLRLGLARLPAAILLLVPFVAVSGLLAILVGVVAAGDSPMPSFGAVLHDLGVIAVQLVVYTGMAAGLSALTGSLSVSLTVMYLWLLIIEPILSALSFLGESRKLLISPAFVALARPEMRFEGEETFGLSVAGGLAVLAVWLVAFLGPGLWRVKTRDA